MNNTANSFILPCAWEKKELAIASLSTFISWVLTKMALRNGNVHLVAGQAEPDYHSFWSGFLGTYTPMAKLVSAYRSETKATCTLHAHGIVLLLLCGLFIASWCLCWILVVSFDSDAKECPTPIPARFWETLLDEIKGRALKKSVLSIKASPAYLEGESGTPVTSQDTYHSKRMENTFDISEFSEIGLSTPHLISYLIRPYQYSILTNRQIRLIKFTRRDYVHWQNTGELRFELENESLPLTEKYYPLSYAWGDLTMDQRVLCNGQWLRINKNLLLALSTILCAVYRTSAAYPDPLMDGFDFRKGDDIFMWADAICINQKDQDEKSRQIPLMGEIYSKAQGVFGYIGNPTASDPLTGLVITAALCGAMTRPLISKLKKLDGGAFQELWSSRWYKRGWVIQEMSLPPKVLCIYGAAERHSICSLDLLSDLGWKVANISVSREISDFLPFADAQNYMNLQRNIGRTHHWWLLKRRLEKDMQQRLDLLEALLYVRSAEVSQAKDKVNCVMGLLEDEERDDFAGYLGTVETQSTKDLYLAVAEICVRTNRSIFLFKLAGLDVDRDDNPSWVPDWRSTSRNYIDSEAFRCAGPTKQDVTLCQPRGKIRVQGAIVDVIEKMGEPYRSARNKQYLKSRPWVKEVFSACYYLDAEAYSFCEILSKRGAWRYSETQPEVVWKTLCWNSGNRNQSGPPLEQENASIIDDVGREHYDAFRAFAWDPRMSNKRRFLHLLRWMRWVIGHIAQFFIIEWDLWQRAHHFTKYVDITLARRALCFTQHGYLGVIPEEAREGDRIAIFLGANVPFVVRPTGNGDYVLVGVCYVHGIMDGELIVQSVADRPVLVRFGTELTPVGYLSIT
jgi:hypothetical protein